jgi:hypothetical protein
MQPEKYTGKTNATQRIGLWVAIAVIVVAGIVLYFLHDRSLLPVLGGNAGR